MNNVVVSKRLIGTNFIDLTLRGVLVKSKSMSKVPMKLLES